MESFKSFYFLVLLGNIFPSAVLAAKGVVSLDSLTFDKVCITIYFVLKIF
jgi:hypothetical protein